MLGREPPAFRVAYPRLAHRVTVSQGPAKTFRQLVRFRYQLQNVAALKNPTENSHDHTINSQIFISSYKRVRIG